jgi:hypothetical protein
LGRSLEFDPKTERFKDSEANKHVKRDYRKGFEVPQLAAAKPGERLTRY